jgi:hypothetical protein
MHTLFLKNDGRCRWLERKVLNGYYQNAIIASKDPDLKKIFLIEEWLSNDNGNIGAHKPWMRAGGVPVLKTYKDVPHTGNFSVFITPYDSIIEEELELRERGVEMIGEPCPAITNLRNIFEKHNPEYQYIFICDSTHVIIRNYRSIFPADMILVQFENFKERINTQVVDKPLLVVPYVTFLPSQVKEVTDFIEAQFPTRKCKVCDTYCIWVKSPTSPVVEIQNLQTEQLNGVSDALLIEPRNTRNTSAASLAASLKKRGLRVVPITSLIDAVIYTLKHQNDTVLVVRSPIPNTVEKPVLTYFESGIGTVFRSLLGSYMRKTAKRLLPGMDNRIKKSVTSE